MPCTMTGSFIGDRALMAEEDLKKCQKERLKLTQMLCALCRMHHGPMPTDVAAWWRRHERQDEGKK